MKRVWIALSALVLVALSVVGQSVLWRLRPAKSPALTDGLLAACGGLRSIAAEVVWFRADRLQEEGRYVELAQLASTLTFLEPHTPEVWGHAAWNLAYNVSLMMPTPADRWRWVHAGIRLLRDEGLALNPQSADICRELAWLFELKLGADLDAASPFFREEWRKIVEDVAARDAWEELRMDRKTMRAIERETGIADWTDPLLSAIYWGLRGGCADIVRQSMILYRKRHGGADGPRLR